MCHSKHTFSLLLIVTYLEVFEWCKDPFVVELSMRLLKLLQLDEVIFSMN